MKEAYTQLHTQGFAHSIEVYREETLVGGLYGIGIGKVFYGESMFSLEPNASKLAIYYLASHLSTLEFEVIDCQVTSNHLLSLGAVEIDRDEFETILCDNLKTSGIAPFLLPDKFPSP